MGVAEVVRSYHCRYIATTSFLSRRSKFVPREKLKATATPSDAYHTASVMVA